MVHVRHIAVVLKFAKGSLVRRPAEIEVALGARKVADVDGDGFVHGSILLRMLRRLAIPREQRSGARKQNSCEPNGLAREFHLAAKRRPLCEVIQHLFLFVYRRAEKQGGEASRLSAFMYRFS